MMPRRFRWVQDVFERATCKLAVDEHTCDLSVEGFGHLNEGLISNSFYIYVWWECIVMPYYSISKFRIL